ncbi:MAG TPA: glycine zipper 2TM domain-containing protein [Noviherbaspirillum sp.]|nr:glycine zipper 2TM domain-containing protein [Noviherbaspirillum sp.]
MWAENIKTMMLGVSMLALAACGSPPSSTSANTGSSIPVTTAGTTSTATGYGVVQSIDAVPREQAGIGLGSVAGAVVGGVLGNQVGSGRGRTAATVAGAAGGALVGHEMQKNSRASENVYRVSVRMDNGAMQTLTQEVQPGVQVGERVRLENGVIVERFR